MSLREMRGGFNNLGDRILEYSNLLESQICELRLHPRTSNKVEWPKKLKKYLKTEGYNINIK